MDSRLSMDAESVNTALQSILGYCENPFEEVDRMSGVVRHRLYSRDERYRAMRPPLVACARGAPNPSRSR